VGDYGYGGASELAKRIGKSVSAVSRRIALLKLPGEVQEELLRRRRIPSIAQELLPLDREDRNRVAELIIHEKKEVTYREVRKIARHVKKENNYSHIDNDADLLEAQSNYSVEEQRKNSLGRALAKGITALKLCTGRLDDIYEHVDEDEWEVREILMNHRRFIHRQVDELMNFRRKVIKHSPPFNY
jgi:ParB family chromosome partitioning protein